MRINKYLASGGVASRRGSEEIIKAGKVKINGRVVTDLSTDVGKNDLVTVDGKSINPVEEFVYLMLNKPKGCLTTAHDERGRATVFDYVDSKATHLFPVGRLDYDTEGLLLITNDGEFANRLTHPSIGIEKTYVVKIEGKIARDQIEKLSKGVVIDGQRTNPAKVELTDVGKDYSRLTVVISEGRNRQVRRMFETIDKTVVFLKRTQIGPLKLGGLGRGQCRPLTPKEVAYFAPSDRAIPKEKVKRR